MSYLLAVDPGVRGCGVALFHDDLLVRAGYVKNTAEKGNGPREAADMGWEVRSWANESLDLVLALEWPQIYQGGKQKGDPNDLLALAAVQASITVLYPKAKVLCYRPREWKGSVDAEVMITRIQGRLSPAELNVVLCCICPKSLLHNVWDAVGLGLFALGRLAPRKVIAR